jgi:hypothetical protein
MALLNPVIGNQTQQFGPVAVGVPGREWQPAMYGNHDYAFWQPYKNWPWVKHFHNALDIGAAAGTPIIASEAGIVRAAGWMNNGGGNVISVEIKPGVRYEHAHCQSIAVGVGQRVARGQTIARVGATGNVTGNHTHFTVTVAEVVSGVTRTVYYNPRHFMPGGKWASSQLILPAVASAPAPAPAPAPLPSATGRVNGDGINIRNTNGTLFARGVSGRLRRYADNVDIGATTGLVPFDGFATGSNHGIQPYPTSWGRLYYNGAWRLVARPLMTATATVSPTQRIHINAGVNIRRGAGTNFAIARTTTAAGQYDSPSPYEVIGQNLTQSGVTSNRWRTVSIAGIGTCYVWAPLARRV